MRVARLLPVMLSVVIMAGCSTTNQTNPARSATEEMLISSAADRAADQLAVNIPKSSAVFVDTTNFDGTDSKYAIAAIHASILKRGAHIVDDKKNAGVIIEARNGAQSTDQQTFLIGVPQTSLPIPLASGTLAIPEIALYKDADQKGVAKFAVTAYDAKTGSLIDAQDPQYGFAHVVEHTILIFFSWTEYDGVPKPDNMVTQGVDHLTSADKRAGSSN